MMPELEMFLRNKSTDKKMGESYMTILKLRNSVYHVPKKGTEFCELCIVACQLLLYCSTIY